MKLYAIGTSSELNVNDNTLKNKLEAIFFLELSALMLGYALPRIFNNPLIWVYYTGPVAIDHIPRWLIRAYDLIRRKEIPTPPGPIGIVRGVIAKGRKKEKHQA